MRHILLAAALCLASPAFAGPAADTGPRANTSVTADDFSVGEAVEDSNGATVGRIKDLLAGAEGTPGATIRLESGQELRVALSSLSPGDHAAVINLTRRQIEQEAGDAGSPAMEGASGAGAAGMTGARGMQNQRPAVGGPGIH